MDSSGSCSLFSFLDFVTKQGCDDYSLLTQKVGDLHEVNQELTNGDKAPSVLILKVDSSKPTISKALNLFTEVKVCGLTCHAMQVAEIVACLAQEAGEALAQCSKLNLSRGSENIPSKTSANPHSRRL